MLLDELLKSAIGDDFYPGDTTPSEHWPGAAPGTRGIINALSPRYCDWSAIVDVDPKPPVLWTYGTEDVVVSDGSAWDIGAARRRPATCRAGRARTRTRRSRWSRRRRPCSSATANARVERFEGSGHFPPIDAAERWARVFFGFLEDCEP